MEMHIRLAGGSRVDAEARGFTIRTDQPPQAGGEGSAPAPFDYFLASIGTCAGYYVARFLHERSLPVEGVRLTLIPEKVPDTRRVGRIVLDLRLPPEVPAKYERALVRAIEQCSVKRHIVEPPQFETRVSVAAPVG